MKPGRDTTFELDKFSRPRLRDPAELIKNVVLFILFSKPGQYPSIPTIGLDIHSLLYSFYDELDEEELKRNITGQCQFLGIYFDNGTINIRKTIYRDKPSLLIHIEMGTENSTQYYTDTIETMDAAGFQIGITLDELDRMIYNVRKIST